MTDYKKQGLDANLRPINSPAVENTKDRVTGYEFNSNNERNAIGATNIQNFSFSTGRGGTLTLGGTANGDGLMVLKNATGGTIFTGDNLGHHYYGTSGVEQLKVDNTGLHAYGTSGTSNELIRTNNTGIHGYNSGGSEIFSLGTVGLITTGDNGVNLRRNMTDVTSYGLVGIDSSNRFVVAANNNNKLFLGATNGPIDITASGTIALSGADITINGASKSAIVPTKEGYKALYTNESPEVWFMDFCEKKDKIDPMFLEVTEAPYHFIKCEGGEYQIWGIRKGFKDKRFQTKTKEEFDKNNIFWETPMR